MAVDLLNPNLGIATLLPSPVDEHLPQVDNFNTVATPSANAVAVFKQSLQDNGFERNLMASFAPHLPSDEMLQPSNLRHNLQSIEQKLASSTDPQIRRFVRDELHPLNDNTALLQAYLGLMVTG